ncbi:hypothetical protein N9J58_00090 [bacterium]|nr:hypothetical protein [bacterium]
MIIVQLTEGFGNNLFQAAFAELLSSQTGSEISVCGTEGRVASLYAKSIGEDKALAFRDRCANRIQRPYKELVDHCVKALKSRKTILLKGNFEYFEIFNDIQIENTRLNIFKSNDERDDTIRVHVRLNNRLVQVNHAINWICPNKLLSYLRGLFPFSKIELISDYHFPVAESGINQSISALKLECRNGPNPGALLLPRNISKDYVYSWLDAISTNKIDCLSQDKIANYRKGSGALNDNYLDDFRSLQNSSVLVFWGSTFSYLASKFAGDEIKTITISPWKNDKDQKGPFLDLDNHFKRLHFCDHRYEPVKFHSKLFFTAVGAIPYSARHYLQAGMSKIHSIIK